MSRAAEDAPIPPRATHYPPYVRTESEQRRWDLAEGIARELFGDETRAAVWMATRSIYHGPIPTDDPPVARRH